MGLDKVNTGLRQVVVFFGCEGWMGLDKVNTGLRQVVVFFGRGISRCPVRVVVIFGAVLLDSSEEFWSEVALFGALFSDFAEFVKGVNLSLNTFGSTFELNNLSFQLSNKSLVFLNVSDSSDHFFVNDSHLSSTSDALVF